MANSLEPVFQVGKYGVTDAVVAQMADAFKTRELLKLKVLLESAPETPKEIAQKLAAATGSEVVQVIGGSMIFYKENKELHEEIKPEKKPATKAQRENARKEKLKRIKAKKVSPFFKSRSRSAAERKAVHAVKVRGRNGGK
jgi:RNA-binding protein